MLVTRSLTSAMPVISGRSGAAMTPIGRAMIHNNARWRANRMVHLKIQMIVILTYRVEKL